MPTCSSTPATVAQRPPWPEVHLARAHARVERDAAGGIPADAIHIDRKRLRLLGCDDVVDDHEPVRSVDQLSKQLAHDREDLRVELRVVHCEWQRVQTDEGDGAAAFIAEDRDVETAFNEHCRGDKSSVVERALGQVADL